MKFKSLVYALFASLLMQASISIACAAQPASNNDNTGILKSNFIINVDKVEYIRNFRKEEKNAEKSGNINDEMKIANVYLHGNQFIEQNMDKSLHWFYMAAVNGSSSAQNILGNFYFYGINKVYQGRTHVDYLGRNYRKAAVWFLISAKNGSIKGLNNFNKISSILSNKEIKKVKTDVSYCMKHGLKKCGFRTASNNSSPDIEKPLLIVLGAVFIYFCFILF